METHTGRGKNITLLHDNRNPDSIDAAVHNGRTASCSFKAVICTTGESEKEDHRTENVDLDEVAYRRGRSSGILGFGQ